MFRVLLPRLLRRPRRALWALLPLVASRRLGLGASGYGVLLAALGIGAVAGALVLPRIRRVLTNNQLLLGAGLIYAATLLVLAAGTVPAVAVLALVPAGVAWMTVLSTVNASMQLFLPGWVRARGLSVYQMIFAGGQALGALAWERWATSPGCRPRSSPLACRWRSARCPCALATARDGTVSTGTRRSTGRSRISAWRPTCVPGRCW